MINDETRKKIEKTLGSTNDAYFQECYREICDGENVIVIYPVDDTHHELTTTYDEETGAFVGLERWSYAKEYGELL
jgi:hypothetical protein